MDSRNSDIAIIVDRRLIGIRKVEDILSSWGNSFCYITEEQIKALQEGKVLEHDDGEYGTFIILRNEGE